MTSYAVQSVIDELNYARDARNTTEQAADSFEREDGTTVKLPMRFEVCRVCRGEGKHVNPSIDAGGISAEQFSEDPDFAESYFGGSYDVTCQCCKGLRVERVVDLEAMSDELRAEYQEWNEREEAAARACWYERMAEIRMGC